MAPASLQFILGLLAAIAMLLATYRLRHRISIGEDFALARRRLPAWLTALSQTINCVPLWLLLAVEFYAYTVGLAALWMALACIAGQAFNWWLIAPRVRKFTALPGHYALSQLLTSASEPLQALTLRSALLIVLFTLGLATITLLQWTAQQWINAVGGSYPIAVIFLGLLLLVVVAFGGLWSASVIDAVQAVIVVFLIAVIAGFAMWEVGGSQALWSGLRARDHLLLTWFNGYSGILAMAFFVGVSFVAFSGSAQPQVFSRYLACKSEQAFKKARLLALAWTFYALIGALLIGWCGRVLLAAADNSHALTQNLLALLVDSPLELIIATLLLIALSAASLSSWLAIATHFATDLRAPNPADATGAGPGLSLAACRWGLFVSAMLVIFGALYLPVAHDDDRLWFCWQALSAAFAPLLFVRLSGKKVRAGSSLGAIWAGFILSGLFHLMPDTAGDLLERSLPFIAAMGIALSGGERRRNPSRADRGDKTVHDHLPI